MQYLVVQDNWAGVAKRAVFHIGWTSAIESFPFETKDIYNTQ